jgi:predicted Zn-dependent protease
MRRRRWLQWGCAHCAVLAGLARAQTAEWAAPPRFVRPDAGGEEGGLWALMDREEARLRRSPFRIRETGLERFLADTACKLGADHCPDIRVYAVRMPYFNANMAPNGMMQVWSGLLLRMDNEAQLVAILAHEIGHYLQRHTLQQLRDAKARAAFATLLAGFGVYGLVGQLVLLGTAFAYSRDQEREADAISLVLMKRNGYDPREATKVWANLLAEASANKDHDPAQESILFATHPPSDERRRTLEQAASGSPGGEIGTERWRQVLAPLRTSLLEDEVKRGRYDESIVLLDRLVAAGPGDAELLAVRGEVRRLRNADGDAAAALADLTAAVQAGKPPAGAFRSLGYLYRAQGRGADARAAWGRFLALSPDAADAALIRQALEQMP